MRCHECFLMAEEFRNFVPADIPNGMKQRLCVVPRADWFDQKSPFWAFAQTSAREGWVWIVSTNFAFVDIQIVLMYLPPADMKQRPRMVWEIHDGRGAFRLDYSE
jgi:hypothetical protein